MRWDIWLDDNAAAFPAADDVPDFPSQDLLKIILRSPSFHSYPITAEWVRNQTVALISTIGESLQLSGTDGRWAATTNDRFVEDFARELVQQFNVSPYDAPQFLSVCLYELKRFVRAHPRKMQWGSFINENDNLVFKIEPLKNPQQVRPQAVVSPHARRLLRRMN